jgi:hypothetical protein
MAIVAVSLDDAFRKRLPRSAHNCGKFCNCVCDGRSTKDGYRLCAAGRSCRKPEGRNLTGHGESREGIGNRIGSSLTR